MDFGPTCCSIWPSDDYAADQALCIEFVNTVSWRGKPEPTDYLSDPEAWLTWMRDECAVPEDAWAELSKRAIEDPGEAEAALSKAKEFREVLFHLLTHDKKIEKADQLAFQAMLTDAMARLRLRRQDDGWRFEPALSSCWEAPLQAAALSAAQLLASPYAKKVKACGREECRWLFLDLTKNHSRKWCDMSSCGNVVKARACYARKKAAKD